MKNNIYRSCVVLLGAVILSCVFAGCSGEEPLSGGQGHPHGGCGGLSALCV